MLQVFSEAPPDLIIAYQVGVLCLAKTKKIERSEVRIAQPEEKSQILRTYRRCITHCLLPMTGVVEGWRGVVGVKGLGFAEGGRCKEKLSRRGSGIYTGSERYKRDCGYCCGIQKIFDSSRLLLVSAEQRSPSISRPHEIKPIPRRHHR